MSTPNKNKLHGTRKNGKALRCVLCGAMAPKDPIKPVQHQKTCPVVILLAKQYGR